MEPKFTGPSFTIGIEEELMILDAETLALANAIEAVLEEHGEELPPFARRNAVKALAALWQVANGLGGQVAAGDGGRGGGQEDQPGVQGAVAEQPLQVQRGQEVGSQQQPGGGHHDQLTGQQGPAGQQLKRYQRLPSRPLDGDEPPRQHQPDGE